MSLGSAIYIEPYGGYGRREQCGVAIVYEGRTEFLTYDQWNDGDRFTESERTIIQDRIVSSSQWKRPTSNLPERYKEYLREFDDFPEGLDEAQAREHARNRMKEILGDIGRRIISGFTEHSTLKRDTDYEIIAVMIVSSFFRNQFPFSPLICVHGAPDSGKSSTVEVFAQFLYHGHSFHGYTGAAVSTAVDKDDVSVCLDELGMNLSGDKGTGILEFLLGSCYEGRSIVRHDYKNNCNRIRMIYTTCMLGLKGTNIPDDLRNRALMVEMPLSMKENTARSISMRKFITYEPGATPEEIRDDLYALKLITMQSEGTEWGERELRGIWFEHFQWETLRQLEAKTKDGRYLYSITYGLDSMTINNRNKDIALMVLTIGECMGFGYDIMKRIVSNAERAQRHTSETTQGRMFEAYARVVRRTLENEGIGFDRIGIQDVIRGVRRIRISEASDEYRRMMEEERTGGEWSDKALFRAFSDLGFVHTKQGMHNSLRVDSDDPEFPEQFTRCLEIYADDETRMFFASVIEKRDRNGV